MDPPNDPSQSHRRGHSTPQSIPLQDLTRPPGGRPTTRRKTFSERGRNLIGRSREYEPLAEHSPAPSPSRQPGGLRLITPNNGSSLRAPAYYNANEASPLSPVSDGAAFQEAMGFAGLSFHGEAAPTRPAMADRSGSIPSFVSQATSDSSAGAQDDRRDFSPPGVETDTTPLRMHSSDLRASPHTTHSLRPEGQRHDRIGSSSVHFAASGRPSRDGSSRLGDELHNAEAGLAGDIRRSGSLRRSGNMLSPVDAGQTLRRAGTIVRAMSQRIVNVSNESAEAQVDRSIRRKSSVKLPRPDLQRLPSVTEYDGGRDPAEGSEKAASSLHEDPVFGPRQDQPYNSPLQGKSLGIFEPDNPIRVKLCDLLVHPLFEPIIFLLILLQSVLLTIDAAGNVYEDPRARSWGNNWIDFAMLVLFIIYSAELVIRVIVSGFIINPRQYSTINRSIGWRKAIYLKLQSFFALEHDEGPKGTPSAFGGFAQPSIVRSFTSGPAMHPDFAGDSRQQQRARLAYRAYLRHSFNRLDFLAVIAYWVSFVLSIAGMESSHHVYVFRMLSCLRIIRLLALTSGTSVILRSLKKAAPMLANVALLIGFFWLLFAIIGVQAFKSSLKRSCVWIDPTGQEDNFTLDWNYAPVSFCGGWLDTGGQPMPWLRADGSNGSNVHKGYLCPINSKCVEGANPYNGTMSFDNIFQSLELVFVMMSANTFSDILYYLTDSDYLAAAFFFAAGLVILFFWLINLLIAVITSSFQVIREESKASAFTGEEQDSILEDDQAQDEAITLDQRRVNRLRSVVKKLDPVFVAIITLDTVVMCLRSAKMHAARESLIDTTETVVTLVLFLEIIMRFAVEWRTFFHSKRNIADLILAVVTAIIQIPQIHDSGQPYAWLSIFQIARMYRVVLAVPVTRDLITKVLGNMTGLLNLIFFVFLINWLAAIFASQLFRGDINATDNDGNEFEITFFTIWNSFLGMYQIFSSENWTSIVYTVTAQEVDFNVAWIGAAFFILWFILGYFIVLNMFIAVIQENFDVSEDEKRLQQVKAFLADKDMPGAESNGNLSLANIFKYSLATGRRRDALDFGNATTELLLKDAVVRDFLDQENEESTVTSPPVGDADTEPMLRPGQTEPVATGSLSNVWGRIVGLFKEREPNPFYSKVELSKAYQELDPTQMAREVVMSRERRKRAQREYLLKHPSYNTSLFIFNPRNPIRRLCQRIVGPGRGGERIEGVSPSVPVWYAFSLLIYCAIVAMVLLACVTTPVYQKQYFQTHKFSVHNWFVYVDLGFAILFTVEAAIKVVADGFFWTPNAYFRGAWGFIDGIVLLTLWVNVATALFNEGQVSRAVGAFKALRALRLLNVSDNARNTFHSVIVKGGWKVISAAFVSLSLLVPFAIYGLNIFHGRLQQCNDGSGAVFDLSDCTGEYLASPYNWDVLAPRQAANPYFNFDSFGDSMFILFQIVSLEGWIDVMWAAESITGVYTQPMSFASQFNPVFFVVFNLLGAVFVLTLFVSVFMRNYTEQTGVAFLTAEQRSWLELRKLLQQISPSKRPVHTKKRPTWQEWCYRRAVRKTGRWQRFLTIVLAIHLLLLCCEVYPSPVLWDRLRDLTFLLFTLLYIANIIIRIIGLTWTRFRKSSWDVYSLFAVGGTFISTILLLTNFNNWIFVQIHKLCLVLIALLLIPRNNQLDQLFKTAAASLPAISSLLATWFVLFLVFAIALTQTFGLTRFGANESGNVNFRSVPKALIFLFRTSVGEGWNEVMEDFATIHPPFCFDDPKFLDGDCGSKDWARALFISWNILSMYIFVNLFVSLIYESFSYVYQRSSGLSIISREETRRYKQAWAEFDPEGTGWISKEMFPRLLGELSGVWEMRVYDGDFTVARLIEDCSRPSARTSAIPIEGQQEEREIDIDKLNERLKALPVAEIRRRRARMNKFYEEVMVTVDPERGISFGALLIILAHYKVINDNKSLRLKEFLRRRARLQRVEEAVRRNIVRGFFDTVFWSRKFRQSQDKKDAGRLTRVPQFTVPEIFVDDEQPPLSAFPEASPLTGPGSNPFLAAPPPSSPHHGNFGGQHTDGYLSDDSEHASRGGATTPPGSDGTGRSRANSIQITPQASPVRERAPTIDFPGRPSLQLPGHSGGSAVSAGGEWQLGPTSAHRDGSPMASASAASVDGSRSRANSAVSAQDVLEVLEDSAWGGAIRRSFTQRRPSRE